MGKTLREVFNNHPELRTDRLFARYCRAFEEVLLMAVKMNHLNPKRLNLEDVYLMDGVIETIDGRTLFYYDAEYSNDKGLFTEDGKFKHRTVHVPIEKGSYFQNFHSSFYIRGNIERVLVLRDIAILDAIKQGHYEYDVTCKHGCERVVEEQRDFISVHTWSAISRRHLKVVATKNWIKAVKEMGGLTLWLT